MADIDLFKPLLLTNANVNRNVDPAPGVYVYGPYSKGHFTVKYVGRSDVDLRARLLKHVGTAYYFKWKNYERIKNAFDHECRLFHKFKPKMNKIHPDRPVGKNWKCPVCDILDD